LEGSVIILADNKKVLHVEDGKIIQDSFDIIPQTATRNLIRECFDIAKREIEGKDLIKYITSMMEVFGNYSPKDNLLHYESKNYIFSQKDEQLKVTAKDGNREVLNDSGFTKVATDSDMTNLQKLKDIYEELTFDDDSQAQRPSLKL
jgi:hypothetical protein